MEIYSESKPKIKSISQYPLFRKKDNIVISAKIFTENELGTIISTQPLLKLKKEKIDEVFFYEIEDYLFEKKIKDLLNKNFIKFSIMASPMFLCSRDKFLKFSENNKVHRMASFYQMMRKELGILVDENNKPILDSYKNFPTKPGA